MFIPSPIRSKLSTSQARYVLVYRPDSFAKMAVYSWGNNKDSFPLICVHGLTGTGRDFDFLAQDFSHHCFRVVAVDLPGHGASDRVLTHTYRHQYYLYDIASLLAFSGVNRPHSCDWLGISMGGILGIRLAWMSGSPIRRLVLDDIGCEVPQQAITSITRYLRYPHIYDSREQLRSIMIENNKGQIASGTLESYHWEHKLDTHTHVLSDGKIGFLWDRNLIDWFEREPVGDVDLWPLWRKIYQPVLLLRGKLSAVLTTDIVQRMTAEKPGAPLDYVEIADCGHVPPLVQNDQIKYIRQWLSQPLTDGTS